MAQVSLASLGALNASFHASRIHGREFVGPLTQAKAPAFREVV
jgi:hypothetical protein